jgi:hypothetical protein
LAELDPAEASEQPMKAWNEILHLSPGSFGRNVRAFWKKRSKGTSKA